MTRSEVKFEFAQDLVRRSASSLVGVRGGNWVAAFAGMLIVVAVIVWAARTGGLRRERLGAALGGFTAALVVVVALAWVRAGSTIYLFGEGEVGGPNVWGLHPDVTSVPDSVRVPSRYVGWIVLPLVLGLVPIAVGLVERLSGTARRVIGSVTVAGIALVFLRFAPVAGAEVDLYRTWSEQQRNEIYSAVALVGEPGCGVASGVPGSRPVGIGGLVTVSQIEGYVEKGLLHPHAVAAPSTFVRASMCQR